MSYDNKQFLNTLLSLPRYTKRILAIIIDINLCIVCTWLALTLILEEIILLNDSKLYSAIISAIIAIPIFWLFGFYRTIFRYAGVSIIFTLTSSIVVYGIVYFSIIGIYSIQGVPRSIGIIQPMLLFFSLLGSRLVIKYILNINYKKPYFKKNVLIYGAGEAGRQLILSLENNPVYKVVGFLDDNNQLDGQVLLGQTVYNSSKLENLLLTREINIVFLAMPTIGRAERNQIIEKLRYHKLTVKTLPSISEIVDGKITILDIKDLNVDDLLNRDEVEPDVKLLNKNINLKTVLVTGAGGSIGSEISRQILRLKPSKLLLLELNEFALYKIYEELLVFKKDFKIIPLLANAQDQKKLEVIFETFEVDTIYHTAAYKHVPLVEENVCEGIKNNVFGTLAAAKASVKKSVSNFVLISSDKAVRPTNVMGATKRLSEICVQAISNNSNNSSTSFSIVRFGNVLETSGSAIPKFKKQIKEGGPISLTHNDVTRYFMTVTEAAQLVIQAGAMGKNAEVFVLDMGESVKIKDLIYKMISLSGLSIKDDNNPKGDIEVKIVGIRPGEKLYEELLIGNHPKKTSHPKIKKTSDNFIPIDQLEKDLFKLKEYIDNNNLNKAKNGLEKLVKLYKKNTEIVDHIYREKLLAKK
jgi:FlaA1/EpsC-like NDP-sugar epimerase